MPRPRCVLLGVICCVAVATAYDTGLHVYLGTTPRAESLWASFDPSFYSALQLPDTNEEGFLTRKFYCIGLTMPDLLLAAQTAASCTLLCTMRGYKVAVDSWYGSFYVSTDGPLHITDGEWQWPANWSDSTYTYAHESICYSNGELPMNSNFQKTWEMAQYVKQQGWQPEYKALFYGCLMHLIEDIYAGVLTSSRFGYGYYTDSDSALFYVTGGFEELYYELFSETYVSEEDWRPCVEKGLFGTLALNGKGQAVCTGGYFDFMPGVLLVNVNGRSGYEQVSGWQHLYVPMVDTFAKVMNRYFSVGNLSYKRLKAWMCGYAMMLFMGYGYERDWQNTQNIHCGGLAGHPDWTPAQIADFLDHIGDDFVSVSVKPAWWMDVLDIGVLLPPWSGIYLLAKGFLMNAAELEIMAKVPTYMPWASLRNLPPSPQPGWTEYFQNPGYLTGMWPYMPDALKALFPSGPTKLFSNTANWFSLAQHDKPNERATFSNEITESEALFPLYADAMSQGPSYIDNFNFNGADPWWTERKACLTGGMYDLTSTSFGREPGVLNMGFKLNASRVWSSTDLYKSGGDPQDVWFFYDVVSIDEAKVVVKAIAGADTSVLWEETLPAHARCRDSIALSGQGLAQAGTILLWYETQTHDGSGQYTTMLSSKYDDAYFAHDDIKNCTLYKALFNEGNPTRTDSQNPFSDPAHFWPYALAIAPKDGWFVAAPTQAGATPTHEGINLTWQNVSQCADRVVILRSVDNGSFVRYDSVGSDSTAYLDADVDSGYSYHYHVVACHDTFASGLADAGSVTFDQRWEHRSDLPKGAKNRHVKDGGSLAGLEGANDAYVYALKGGNTCEFYRYSMGNQYWQACESVPAVQYGKRVSKGAALAAGSDGRLYALKGNHTYEFWRYDPSLSGSGTYPWSKLDSVPPGPSGKRVMEGAGLAAVTVHDTCFIYFLKGSNTCEFFRYNTLSGAWATMDSAPMGQSNRRFKDGSCLTYDPDNDSIYALKGGTNEFFSYSATQNTWASSETMPRIGQSGKMKVAGYGTSLAYESGRVYALKGHLSNDFLSYRPDQGAWAIACSLPLYPGAKGVFRGGALTAIAGHLWALRGNNTLDFWRYTPGQEQGLAADSGEPGPGQNELLVASAQGAANPRWSADGNYVVYTAQAANGRDEVFAAYVNDTLSPLQITNIEGQCACPSFAPNNNHVVFQYQLDTAAYSRIEMANLQGDCIATVGRSGADCHNPVWSSNGQKIYFESDYNGYSQLWSVSSGGGTLTQLTISAMDHALPRALSSTELIFQGEDNDGFGQIFRLAINSGTETQLTSSSTDHESPTVAQTPRVVAYVVTDQYGYQQVGKVSADGGSEAWLTSGQSDHTAPSITSDGRTIECTQSNVGSNSICEYDTLTGSATQRTDNCAVRESPDSRVTNSAQRWVTAAYARSGGIYRTVNGGGGGGQGNVGPIVSFDAFGPNPSTGRSTLYWSLRAPTKVQIRLFDVTGRSVRTFVNGATPAGKYRTQLDTRRLAHGVYILKMKAGEYRKTYKLILE